MSKLCNRLRTAQKPHTGQCYLFEQKTANNYYCTILGSKGKDTMFYHGRSFQMANYHAAKRQVAGLPHQSEDLRAMFVNFVG